MKPRLVMPARVSAPLERGRPITAAAEAAPISMPRLVRPESIFEAMSISCCYRYALSKSGKERAIDHSGGRLIRAPRSLDGGRLVAIPCPDRIQVLHRDGVEVRPGLG